MSIFSKLFGKEEKKVDESSSVKKERPTIETSFAVLYYTGSNRKEIGYEGEFDWYDKPQDEKELISYYPVGFYIDCDTPDTTEAGLCLERLTRLFEDRNMTDFKVKLEAAEHFAGRTDPYTGNVVTKDEIMEDLKINFISIYRGGKTVYSLDQYCIPDYEGDVHVVFDDDGNVSFIDDYERYNFYG